MSPKDRTSPRKWRSIDLNSKSLYLSGSRGFAGLVSFEELDGNDENILITGEDQVTEASRHHEDKRGSKKTRRTNAETDAVVAVKAQMGEAAREDAASPKAADNLRHKARKTKRGGATSSDLQSTEQAAEDVAGGERDVTGSAEEALKAKKLLRRQKRRKNRKDRAAASGVVGSRALRAGEDDGGRVGEENQQVNKQATKQKQPARATKSKKVVRQALSGPANHHMDMAAWRPFELHTSLVAGLRDLGFSSPTAIQAACLPAALRDWKDIVGAAQTGSGKTLAFALPILQRVLEVLPGEHADDDSGSAANHGGAKGKGGELQALVLTPTRELALQVADDINAAARHTTIRAVALVGGMSVQKQRRQLSSRPLIVVATPGRLWDLMAAGDPHLTSLSHLRFLVFDEADRMLEQGHFAELQNLLRVLPRPYPYQPNVDVQLDPEPKKPKLLAQDKKRKRRRWDDNRAAGDAQGGGRLDKDQSEDEAEVDQEAEQEEGSGADWDGIEVDADDDHDGGGQGEDDGGSASASDEQHQGDDDQDQDQCSDHGQDALGEPSPHEASPTEHDANGDAGGDHDELQEPDKLPVEPASLEDVKDVFAKAGPIEGTSFVKRQTFLFSATLTLPRNLRRKHPNKSQKGAAAPPSANPALDALLERIQFRNAQPHIIDLTPQQRVVTTLQQTKIECQSVHKDVYMYAVLTQHPGRTLVFVNAISSVRRLVALLNLLRVPAVPLHANMQQRQRLKFLDRFQSSANGVLIATDVAARGLDIPHVSCVIHYHIPNTPQAYIHRSGRTARAMSSGLSVALVSAEDRGKYTAICKYLAKPAGLPEYSLDPLVLPRLRQRVSIAHQLDRTLSSGNKEEARNKWFVRMCKDMDLDESQYLCHDDDEQVTDTLRRQRIAKQAAAQQLTRQLNTLLDAPLLPSGFSLRYFTGVEDVAAVLPLITPASNASQRATDLPGTHRRHKAKRRKR